MGGDDRALGQGDIRGVLAEIGARGGLHAVGVFAQIDLVQIDGQDFIFGEILFQAIGQNGLLHLALVAALGGQQELLDELLRDSAAALAGAAFAEIVDGRAGDGQRVHAHVPVEGVVLGGQKRHGQKA